MTSYEEIEIDEVVLVKLSTGEQMIGIMVDNSESEITLTHPFRIKLHYKEQSDLPAVALYYWDEISDSPIVALNKYHILYVTVPKEPIIVFYNTQVEKYYLTESIDGPDVDQLYESLLSKLSSNNSIN